MTRSFITNEAVPQISAWLQSCHQNHASCAKAARHADIFCTDNSHMISDISSDSVVPTRLLQFSLTPDVQGNDFVKVVRSRDLAPSTKYIALSHRWGRTESCTLDKANHDEITTLGMKIQDLPLTYRESVELCRGLEIPFLWIDSLCIIQDDVEDWKNEAKRMAIIYDKATVTIAAADGLDSNSGLHIEDPSHAKFATLSTRAWVCQEDMISPRTVAFTQGTVVWDCRQAEAQMKDAALRSRDSGTPGAVPVHPKDLFCFFRDWRLPRPTKAAEQEKLSELSSQIDETEAETTIQHPSLPGNEASKQHSGSYAASNTDDDVLCLEGPLSEEEREVRRGQSYIEIIRGSDGKGSIVVHYGDDLSGHAAHIAEHKRITGQ